MPEEPAVTFVTRKVLVTFAHPIALLRFDPAAMTPTTIRNLRRTLGMTQVQFAAAVGVNPITISRWERGVGPPSQLALASIERLRDNPRQEAQHDNPTR